MKFGVSGIVGHFLRSLGLVAAVLMLIFGTARVYAAQPYQSGAYGDCAYSLGCDSAVDPPTTVVTVPPSTQNPQTGRAFSVNLRDGQQFKDPNYDIIVTPNFLVDQIKNVEVYLNGKLVAISATPQSGIFVLPWQLPKTGSYNLQVVMNLNDGSVISQRFAVGVTLKTEPTKTGRHPTAEHPGVGQAGWLRKLVNSTPRPLAYAAPYLFFLLLVLILLVLLYQTRNQLVHIKVLLALLERDKQLADEKANFIMLASHYVRTPLTILAGTIELALSGHPADPALLSAQQQVSRLHSQAEIILSSVQENKDFANIQHPDIGNLRGKLYRSWALFLPITLSAILVIGINVLYLSARRINLVIPNIILQLVVFVVLAVFMSSLVQRRHQQRDEAMRVDRQRDYQEVLDKARNQFIKLSAETLAPEVAKVKVSFGQSRTLQASLQINSAISQLESLVNRFVLVTELERGKIERSLSQFYIEPSVQQVVGEFDAQIDAKKLMFAQRLGNLELNQAKSLLEYAIRTLVDNAVKFTPDAGKVVITTAPHGRKAASVTVQNYGQSIEPTKLDRLFQPFSRSQSAEVANQSGAGLSLYLSRLIMRYLDGDVGLESDVAKASVTAKLTLPRKLQF